LHHLPKQTLTKIWRTGQDRNEDFGVSEDRSATAVRRAS
jgi:hypothetical protein